MKLKIIRQLNDSITWEFYNSNGKKMSYEITDIQKDGLGEMYTIKGLRICQCCQKKEENE